MNEVAIVGVDLAKTVFHIHGASRTSEALFSIGLVQNLRLQTDQASGEKNYMTIADISRKESRGSRKALFSGDISDGPLRCLSDCVPIVL